MSNKKACYNCKNMLICVLRPKIEEAIAFGFSRHIITPTDTNNQKGASVRVYEIIGEACYYFKRFPREKNETTT